MIRTSGLDTEQLGAELTQRAGLAGLSDGSGDMREVLADRAAGDLEATTAVRTYSHWLRREIAAAASLECLDALVLTADSVSVLHLVGDFGPGGRGPGAVAPER